jgi:hypothetical protein
MAFLPYSLRAEGIDGLLPLVDFVLTSFTFLKLTLIARISAPIFRIKNVMADVLCACLSLAEDDSEWKSVEEDLE